MNSSEKNLQTLKYLLNADRLALNALPQTKYIGTIQLQGWTLKQPIKMLSEGILTQPIPNDSCALLRLLDAIWI